MAYKQLTLERRYEIKAYIQAGFSKATIAYKLGVHKSTITREISRNSTRNGYFAKAAHIQSLTRKKQASKHKRFTSDIQSIVERLLQLDFSPEQISGRLKRRSPSQLPLKLLKSLFH